MENEGSQVNRKQYTDSDILMILMVARSLLYQLGRMDHGTRHCESDNNHQDRLVRLARLVCAPLASVWNLEKG
jgi:hypothetical protein